MLEYLIIGFVSFFVGSFVTIALVKYSMKNNLGTMKSCVDCNFKKRGVAL